MNNQLSGTDIPNSNDQSWAERNGFSDGALALLWIIAAFFLFQGTSLVVTMVLAVAQSGSDVTTTELMQQLTENLDILFVGNSAGQIVFLGFATWLFTRLHTSKENRNAFLRFKLRRDTGQLSAIAVVLIIAIQPSIWLLSWLNSLIPVPEMFANIQNTQMQMIEHYLRGDHLLILTLFHVGVVPAICEETLYRGYALRAFEKSWGIWPAIIVSGLLFGLYHVQLSNLLPLASIGILLAYITWISRSVIPAMAGHFVNNAGSVVIGTYYPKSAFAEMTPETVPPIWAVILSLGISAYIIYWMYNRNRIHTNVGG